MADLGGLGRRGFRKEHLQSRRVDPHRFFETTTINSRVHPETDEILSEEQVDRYAVHPDNMPSDWDKWNPEQKWDFLNNGKAPATHPLRPTSIFLVDSNDEFGTNITGSAWIGGYYRPLYEGKIDPRSLKVMNGSIDPQGYTADDWDESREWHEDQGLHPKHGAVGSITLKVEEDNNDD
mgnify:CR=1 FL=1